MSVKMMSDLRAVVSEINILQSVSTGKKLNRDESSNLSVVSFNSMYVRNHLLGPQY